MNGKILLADDNEIVRQMYTDFLRKNGYEVIPVTSGYEVIEAFKYYLPFDLILLDLKMAHMDGFEVLEKLKRPANVPIVILTANDGEREENKCLELGADDFVSKTTSLKTLLSIINSHISENARKESKTNLVNGGVIIDHDLKKVYVDGADAKFTTLEFLIFECISDHIGQVVNRQDICKVAWGDVNSGVVKYLDSHISNIRSKLKEYQIIEGRKGCGFAIDEAYKDKTVVEKHA